MQNILELVTLVEVMRTSQKTHRQRPSIATLADAQRREVAVDDWLRLFREWQKQKGLFDDSLPT